MLLGTEGGAFHRNRLGGQQPRSHQMLPAKEFVLMKVPDLGREEIQTRVAPLAKSISKRFH